MNARCAYLRTKMDYVAHASAAADGTDVQAGTSQKHFWCLRTMKPLGPDGTPVDDVLCVRERECFVAEGEV
ncbi:MAG: hypothetical protein HPY54_11805 [Chthonomonadetes bacterium]|nr:hypothetical protein [Chthonomonadetes bacterium]